MLSWLARSFCFFLLVASSKPRDTLLWPGALVLLDIFSRLEDTNGPPGSVMESGSGVRRFLPGPAILATLCGQTLWQGTSGLKRGESRRGRRSRQRRPHDIRTRSLPRHRALWDQCPRVTCRESPAGRRHPPHRSCCSACCQSEGSSKPPAHNLYVARVTNPENYRNTCGSCHDSTQGSRGVKGASNHTSQPPGSAGTAWLGARGRSAAILVRQCPCERPALGERTALRRKRGEQQQARAALSPVPEASKPPWHGPSSSLRPPAPCIFISRRLYRQRQQGPAGNKTPALGVPGERAGCAPPAGSASCSTQRPAALFQVLGTERSCRGLPELSLWRRRQQRAGKASLSPAQLCLAPLQREQPSPVTPVPARTWRPLSGCPQRRLCSRNPRGNERPQTSSHSRQPPEGGGSTLPWLGAARPHGRL